MAERGDPIPLEEMAGWFRRRSIPFLDAGALNLGFGEGQPQYRLYDYPGPQDEETMGMFLEWSTADYFDVPHGAHLALGMRGPVPEDPHRGRGLAIGMFSNRTTAPDGSDVELFAGAPEPPGGPGMFLEEFTVNDGHRPIHEWQLSRCRDLPALVGHRTYRIDLFVSRNAVWTNVWEVLSDRSHRFLDHTNCGLHPPRDDRPAPSCAEDPGDRGVGNAFVGNGFAAPDNRSRIEALFIAHWPNRPEDDQTATR
jgi:hypothetical protein